jgi:hypothetical protein
VVRRHLRFFGGPGFNPALPIRTRNGFTVSGELDLVVILSETKDLLLSNRRKKQIPRANPALGMTVFEFFRNLFSR